jgi:hypothetical protein
MPGQCRAIEFEARIKSAAFAEALFDLFDRWRAEAVLQWRPGFPETHP